MIQSAEEFVRLRNSLDPAEYLRAANDSARLEVWQDVISNYPDLRKWVAHNKTVPLEILGILAHDADPVVRCFGAMKNKLSSELMLLLAGDKDYFVRQGIVYNKNASIEALRKLSNDPEVEIAKAAQERLGRFIES